MINKQKLFEDIKVILSCLFVGLVVSIFTESLSKGIFTGVFILLFYFSYENLFSLKREADKNFSEKIISIIGFSLGLLIVSATIAWIVAELIKK